MTCLLVIIGAKPEPQIGSKNMLSLSSSASMSFAAPLAARVTPRASISMVKSESLPFMERPKALDGEKPHNALKRTSTQLGPDE